MELVSEIHEWTDDHQALATCLVVLSLLSFVGSLFLAPWILVRLPANYFSRHRSRRVPVAARRPALRLALLLGKNVLGVFILAMGLLMLVFPGQGVLTVVAGLILIDFPGKYRLQRYLITRPPVWRSANWIRRRAGRPPLQAD